MKLIVISDTHGYADVYIERILRLHRDCDAVLFLGDGIRDFTDMNVRNFFAVRGNCDIYCPEDVPTERLLTFDGVTILMMHGHTHSVKSGTARLEAYARALGADVALYGHTHRREERYCRGDNEEKGIYLFNPGSLGESRGDAPTYGIVEIKKGQLLLSFGDASRI